MLRQVFCEVPLASVFGAVPPQARLAYVKMYGITLFWGNTEISMQAMLLILAGVTVVFLLLSAIKLRRFAK
jgi:hypothetical protein